MNLDTFDQICEKLGVKTFNDYMFDAYGEARVQFQKQFADDEEPTDEQWEEFHENVEERMAKIKPRYFDCGEMLATLPRLQQELQQEPKWKKRVGKDMPEVVECLEEMARRFEIAKAKGAKFNL